MNSKTILAVLTLFTIICSVSLVNGAVAQPVPMQKHIAFRDDDIAPFYRLDTLEAVNHVHIDENVPVTLGIIPHPSSQFTGNALLQDTQFFNYMQSIDSNPLFEFAQHGYSHVNDRLLRNESEFAKKSYDVQLEQIQTGQADIKQAFGTTPTTFIPPFDKSDDNTVKAAATLGFAHYSTGAPDSHIVTSQEDGMQIETAIWIGGANNIAFNASVVSATKATERFLNDSVGSDTLTIAYHWWAFNDANGSVDAQKIIVFKEFIDYLKVKGFCFTRIDRSQGNENVALPESSSLASQVLSTKQGQPFTFIVIGVSAVALFGAYAVVLRKRLRFGGRRG